MSVMQKVFWIIGNVALGVFSLYALVLTALQSLGNMKSISPIWAILVTFILFLLWNFLFIRKKSKLLWLVALGIVFVSFFLFILLIRFT